MAEMLDCSGAPAGGGGGASALQSPAHRSSGFPLECSHDAT